MSAPGGAVLCDGASLVDRSVAKNVVNNVLEAAHPGAQTLA
jgi:hypothetical protein